MILAIAILLALLAFVGLTYNSLARLRLLASNAWADIDVQLKRRHDLIPSLVAAVKGHAGYEKGTLESVVEARNRAAGASGPAAAGQAEGALAASVRQVFALGRGIPRSQGGRELPRAPALAHRDRGSHPERSSLLQRRRARSQYPHRPVPGEPHRRPLRLPAAGVLRTQRRVRSGPRRRWISGPAGEGARARAAALDRCRPRGGAAHARDRAVRRGDHGESRRHGGCGGDDHRPLRGLVERDLSHHPGRVSHAAGIQLDAAARSRVRHRGGAPAQSRPEAGEALRQVQDLGAGGRERDADGRAPLPRPERPALLRGPRRALLERDRRRVGRGDRRRVGPHRAARGGERRPCDRLQRCVRRHRPGRPGHHRRSVRQRHHAPVARIPRGTHRRGGLEQGTRRGTDHDRSSPRIPGEQLAAPDSPGGAGHHVPRSGGGSGGIRRGCRSRCSTTPRIR